MLERLVRLRSWLLGIQSRVESAETGVRSWGNGEQSRAMQYVLVVYRPIYQKKIANIFRKTRVEWQLETGVILRHGALVIGGPSGKAWPYR